MNVPPPRLWVAIDKHGVFVKIAGRASFTASPNFKTLMQELLARGYQQFTLDLTDCVLMDSTFLGVLAGLSLKSRAAGAKSKCAIRLLNANPRILAAFDTMGILDLFETASGAAPPAPYEETGPPPPANRAELARTSLEAHQTLMSLAPGNVPKFKDVAKFLAEDLEKMGINPDAPSTRS